MNEVAQREALQQYFSRLYGDTAPLLRFTAGEPTLNLLGLLAPTIGAPLETVAQEALARRCAVVVSGLADPATDDPTLSIRVSPLDTPDAGGSRLLVSFIRGVAAGTTGAADLLLRDDTQRGGGPGWIEALRLSHEELESSREELQALNEELRASNDQLNLTNDELATANTRLQSKIEELETQSNVLGSGAVMTLFLDHDLRVRWFTPAIGELFPLVPSDAGRRITDFIRRFDDENFIAAVRAVMQRNEPCQAEVRSDEGKWFLRRIGPYLGKTDIPGGVAVTFSDISARKRAEEQLRASNEELERFNKTAVGRELRMIDLKKQINALLDQRGEPARYPLEFEAKDNDADNR